LFLEFLTINCSGRVDIVICNAGILYLAHTLDLTTEQIQLAYNVNVLGVLHVSWFLVGIYLDLCNKQRSYTSAAQNLKNPRKTTYQIQKFQTIRAFLPEFEHENRGQIVSMSSIAGFYGETYGMAYW
jgi:NAD(P)-dependent dehydrogenase (short-subunit alcohol dehydrogenase family)